MQVTFTAKGYRPELVTVRYVRANGEGYSWCEVGADRRYDLRQGHVEADELPPEVKADADALRGTWPGYALWPA
jgi:hypothetical protein